MKKTVCALILLAACFFAFVATGTCEKGGIDNNTYVFYCAICAAVALSAAVVGKLFNESEDK